MSVKSKKRPLRGASKKILQMSFWKSKVGSLFDRILLLAQNECAIEEHDLQRKYPPDRKARNYADLYLQFVNNRFYASSRTIYTPRRSQYKERRLGILDLSMIAELNNCSRIKV